MRAAGNENGNEESDPNATARKANVFKKSSPLPDPFAEAGRGRRKGRGSDPLPNGSRSRPKVIERRKSCTKFSRDASLDNIDLHRSPIKLSRSPFGRVSDVTGHSLKSDDTKQLVGYQTRRVGLPLTRIVDEAVKPGK